MKAKYNLALHLKVMASFFMGFVAGIGFNGTILVFAIAIFLGDESPVFLISAKQWMVHTALFWGIAAGALTWFGGARAGLLILGGCGLLSGAFVAGAGGDWSVPHMVAGGLAGLLYGGIGGYILGRVFTRG